MKYYTMWWELKSNPIKKERLINKTTTNQVDRFEDEIERRNWWKKNQTGPDVKLQKKTNTETEKRETLEEMEEVEEVEERERERDRERERER